VRLECGHGRREATSDRLIASAERPVTIIPLTIGLSVTSKNRFRQPVTGSEKQTVLTSLVYTVQMFFPVTEQAASQECTELGAMTPHFLGLLTPERKDIRHNLYEAQLLVNPLPLSST